MSASLVGDMELGLLNPISFSCLAPAGINLQGQLTAALALQAQAGLTPPSLGVQLAALLEAEAALRAGIALGLPGVTFSVSAAAALVASIRAQIGLLDVLLQLFGASVFVYKYSGGTVSTIGSDLSTAIAAQPPPGLFPSSPSEGILIGAGVGAWLTVKPYFGGL